MPVAHSHLCSYIFALLQKYRRLFADLLHCTNEPNVSIPTLANLLIERTQNPSWVVVYKALITTHHLMCYGNEVTLICLKDASFKCTFVFSRGSPSISPQATATFSSMASWTKREFRVSQCKFVKTGVHSIKVVKGQCVLVNGELLHLLNISVSFGIHDAIRLHNTGQNIKLVVVKVSILSM